MSSMWQNYTGLFVFLRWEDCHGDLSANSRNDVLLAPRGPSPNIYPGNSYIALSSVPGV